MSEQANLLDNSISIQALIQRTPAPEGAFWPVAKKAIDYGFDITGLIPSSKKPRPHEWQKHPITNLVDARFYAMAHPDDKVGIYLIQGVGKPMVVDIDALELNGEDVIARLERETGRIFKPTRTVLSRPQSKRFKRHLYLVQTAYSVSTFGDKTKLVRTLGEAGILASSFELYDILGIGGARQVVAEGSVRDDSREVYELEDASVLMRPIEDWEVDWLLEDSRRRKSEIDKVRYQQNLATKTALALAKAGTHYDWRAILKTRIPTYAAFEIEAEDREYLALKLLRKHCGNAIADDPEVKKSVHKAAFDKTLKMGRLPVTKKYVMASGPGMKITQGYTSRHTKWRAVVATFPAAFPSGRLHRDEAEKRISVASLYDRDNAADRSELRKVRKDLYNVNRTTGFWEEIKEQI